MQTSRRAFLKGLIATAVATQLPNLTPEAQAKTTEYVWNAVDHLRVPSGSNVISCGMRDMGNGWYQCWKTFVVEDVTDCTVGIKADPDSDGGYFMDANHQLDAGEYTYSIMLKQDKHLQDEDGPAIISGDKSVYMAMPQVERTAGSTSDYIATGTHEDG